MEKAALEWLRGMKKNQRLSTWGQFKLDLRKRFEASKFEDKLWELSRLQQTSSVAIYLNRFDELANEVSLLVAYREK